jgi:hypothetical protein
MTLPYVETRSIAASPLMAQIAQLNSRRRGPDREDERDRRGSLRQRVHLGLSHAEHCDHVDMLLEEFTVMQYAVRLLVTRRIRFRRIRRQHG